MDFANFSSASIPAGMLFGNLLLGSLGDALHANVLPAVFVPAQWAMSYEAAVEEALRRSMEEQKPPGPPPTPKDLLAKILDSEVCLDTAMLKVSQSCSVCLETLHVGDRGVVLGCQHVFHKDCLASWLKLHNTCPLCRAEAVPGGASASAPSSSSVSRSQSPTTPTPTTSAPNPAASPSDSPQSAASSPAQEEGPSLGQRCATSEPVPQEPSSSPRREGSASTAEPAAAADADPVTHLPPSELKRRLDRLGVDYTGACEKHELVALLRAATAASSRP